MANIINSFAKLQYTTAGILLESKLKTGKALKITRAVIGSGTLSEDEDVMNLTSLKAEIPSHQSGTSGKSATVDIVNIEIVSAGTVNIRIRIKNGDTSFYLREIGIMAEDPDEGEILYMYTNCGADAQAFPEFDGSNHIYRTIDFLNIISTASDFDVNVTLNTDITYDDYLKLNDKISQLQSTRKIDLIYNITQMTDGYSVTIQPTVNYREMDTISELADRPTLSSEKSIVFVYYDYDNEKIQIECTTTVSGRPSTQAPFGTFLSITISGESDCGDFEHHRLIQKDNDGYVTVI